jgi:hypothetical protein
MGKEDRKPVCWVRLQVRPSGLRLAQPGGPTDRVSVLFPLFYLKTEAESSFRNVVVLLLGNVSCASSNATAGTAASLIGACSPLCGNPANINDSFNTTAILFQMWR